jgi:hypothetical protein
MEPGTKNMTNNHYVSSKALIGGLNAMIRDNNPDGFIRLCQETKAKAIELIHHNWCDHASSLMKEYNELLEEMRPVDPGFFLKVIEVFPDNNLTTLKLLGINADLDNAILTQKVDVKSKTPLPIAGCDRLVLWALEHRDMTLLEDVITNVCQSLRDHYADQEQFVSEIFDMLLAVLVYRQKAPYLMSAVIDDELSSIVTPKKNKFLNGEVVDLLGKMAMPKTLIALLEHGRFGTTRIGQLGYSKHVRACIPKVMTTRQLSAVLYFLDPPGLAEKVLFSRNYDLDAYIQSLRETSLQINYGCDLNIGVMGLFEGLLTPENFAVPARKVRMLKLLNAVCEAQFATGRFSVEGLVTQFIKFGIPEFLFKHIDRLKGAALEEALGL